MLSSVLPASHARQLFLSRDSCLPLPLPVNAPFLAPIPFLAPVLSLTLLQLLVPQEPAKVVGSAKKLFQPQPLLPVAAARLAALNNFSVYFMYKIMCEWCGHTDEILF